MVKRGLKSLGAGAVAALLAIVIYLAALGCFIALMLLVISMEEGGTTLTNGTVPLTEAMVLLSQGSGFSSGVITLTIMPLLLTVMLIAMVAVLAARMGTSVLGYAAGLAIWEGVNLYLHMSLAQGSVSGVTPLDESGMVALKCGTVFTIGYAMAALPRSAAVRAFREKLWPKVSAQVRRTIALGVGMAVLIVLTLMTIALVTVIVWVVLDYDGMGTLFAMLHMGMGSRIITTAAMVAWLPNFMIWALSWVSGAGFSIGELAAFSLWVGQSTDLPPLPVFGLLPSPVTSESLRIAFVVMPAAFAFLIALTMILMRRGFGLAGRMRGNGESFMSRRTVLELAYPAGACCIAAALVALFSTLCFALSNGSLGTGRLAHVGVDVTQSAQTIGHGVTLGLLAAWLCALIGIAGYFGIRWSAGRIRSRGVRDAKDGQSSSGTAETGGMERSSRSFRSRAGDIQSTETLSRVARSTTRP